jgi:Protein of unknown function (DUF3455)
MAMNFKQLVGGIAAAVLLQAPAGAEIPDQIASAETPVATIQAQGAQVYECKADANGRLEWQFREPIASLFVGGKTVGRHFAGPTWELTDGSKVIGKVVGQAPGATGMDIPLLKLDAVPQRDSGMLAGVTTIQRLNTLGGAAHGRCLAAGEMLSVAYSADYAFLRKPRWSLIPDTSRHD